MANSLTIKVITHLKLLNFARVCNTIYKRISEQEWTSGNRAQFPSDSNFRLRLALLLYETTDIESPRDFRRYRDVISTISRFSRPGDFNGNGPALVNFSSLLRHSAARLFSPEKFLASSSRGSFYIRSRFTAPRKEVVRFSTLKAYFQRSSFSFDMSLAVPETRH